MRPPSQPSLPEPFMRQRITIESICKGICLALAIWLGLHVFNWPALLVYVSLPILGMAAGLVWLTRSMAPLDVRSKATLNGPLKLFCTALDRPLPIILGTTLGMILAGILLIFWQQALPAWQGGLALLLGGLIGWSLTSLPATVHPWLRLLAAVAIMGGIAACLHWAGKLNAATETAWLSGWALLLAAPLLGWLSSLGERDETELELAGAALTLGLAIWLLVPETMRLLAVALPLIFLTAYVRNGLKPWLAFKHTLRGWSAIQAGDHLKAFQTLRQAIHHAPRNADAQAAYWHVHRQISPQELLHQPRLLAFIDFDLCLQRVKGLLLQSSAPAADQIQEALQLLQLILDQRPHWQPVVFYWRAVAHAHAGELDKAADELKTLLTEPHYSPEQLETRQSVHLLAWQLALMLHPGLRQRVGDVLLREGYRMKAIAVVEEALAKDPADAIALALKQHLYADLTEEEYLQGTGAAVAAAADGPKRFDHGYCFELGQQAIQDPLRWRLGVRWLRIAAHGQPRSAPALFQQIAQAAEANDDPALAAEAWRLVKAWGKRLGPDQLSETSREAYFQTVKRLADEAIAKEQWEAALEHLTLYMTSPQSGAETLRQITELYERIGDVPRALVSNAQCLVYDARHPLHLERQDKYYYSLTPDMAQRHESLLKSAFDVGYCLRKGRELLDHRQSGPEQVDWALHLALLAGAMEPRSVSAHVLAGRCRLRRGEIDAARDLLEFARQTAEGQWTQHDSEEDWHLAHRLLGDLYLEQGQPEQAIACFTVYRKAPQSGAATLYKMGQAYEALGDLKRAITCFEHVGIYDNPLAPEARSAIARLKAQMTPS